LRRSSASRKSNSDVTFSRGFGAFLRRDFACVSSKHLSIIAITPNRRALDTVLYRCKKENLQRWRAEEGVRP
jgi:hypothetical protein